MPNLDFQGFFRVFIMCCHLKETYQRLEKICEKPTRPLFKRADELREKLLLQMAVVLTPIRKSFDSSDSTGRPPPIKNKDFFIVKIATFEKKP